MTFSIDNLEGGCYNPTSENIFFLLKSSHLSIFHQLVLHSSTSEAILIKRRPHTAFCAPCHEVNGHDVYLAMNRKPGYDFSVSNEAIFKQ